MSARLRLQAFRFEMTREGRRESFVFYALSREAAFEMAESWAESRGWTVQEPSA